MTTFAKLYRADAVEFMQSLDDSSADAVISDPPYCSGGFQESAKRNGKGSVGRRDAIEVVTSDQISTSGYVELLRRVAVQAARVLKPGGLLCLFADWRMVSVLQPAVESAGLQYRSLVVWMKPSPGLGIGFRSQHEVVLVFSRGTPSFHSAKHGNVIRSPRSKNEHHTTEKPLAIMSPLVETCTPAGGLVVDPFMGSGSTGVAALSMGRSFIGCDVEQHHLETAVARLGQLADVSAPQAPPPPAPSLFSFRETT